MERPFELGFHSGDDRSFDVFAQLRIAERRPSALLTGTEMIKIMRDATLAATQVVGHVRAHDGPAHARAFADGCVDIGDTRDPLFDQVDRLTIKRGG